MVHEVAHLLGTVDLYGGKSRIDQGMSIMSGTITGRADDKWSINMDPYHKMRLGWIRPRIYEMSEDGGRFQVMSNQLYGNTENEPKRPVILFNPSKGSYEYFMLESRRRAGSAYGFDNSVISSGVALWRIRTNTNHQPAATFSLHRNDDNRLSSVRLGDDFVIRDAAGVPEEIAPGADNVLQSSVRGDDVRIHDNHVYTIGPPNVRFPRVGRGRPWVQADSSVQALIWSSGSNSNVQLDILDHSLTGIYTVNWRRGLSGSGRSFDDFHHLVSDTVEVRQGHEKCLIEGDHIAEYTPEISISTDLDKVGGVELLEISAELNQNAPNPFHSETLVTFSQIREGQNAQLIISDQYGKTVHLVALAPGRDHHVFHRNTLPAGVYSYTLMIDRKLIDSKRMVIQ